MGWPKQSINVIQPRTERKRMRKSKINQLIGEEKVEQPCEYVTWIDSQVTSQHMVKYKKSFKI